MKKRLLGIGLTLLTIALWAGPIIAALQAHGWSLGETLMPGENQISGIEDRVDELIGEDGISGDDLSVSNQSIDGRDFTLTLRFDSPLGFNIVLTKFEATISDGTVDLGQVDLVENAEVATGEKTDLHFSGTLSKRGKQRIKEARRRNTRWTGLLWRNNRAGGLWDLCGDTDRGLRWRWGLENEG